MNLISRSHQRPCYDAITVFDFCGTIGRAWIRTMHTRCSYACLPLSYRPTSIVCLQGLCRILVSLLTIEHGGMMLENTAGRSRSVLNRIILAAKEIRPMPNHRFGKHAISRTGLTRFELVMWEPKSRALPLGDSPKTDGHECSHTPPAL